jgi:multiple sugar transport system permease protein
MGLTAPVREPDQSHDAGWSESTRRIDERRRRMKRRTSASLTGWSFIAPATLLVVGLAIFPAVWAFVLSRKKTNLIAPASDVGWNNYELMLKDPGLRDAVMHTLFFTAVFVPVSILVGMVLAIALNQKIRLTGFYRTCIFVPFVASAAATGILANFVFDPTFGLANNALRVAGLPQQKFLESPTQAMVVLVIIALWGSIGFNVVVYLAALQDIPRDVVEAALMDGANRRQVFVNVTMPALGPVTVFTTIWQVITALQLFDLVYTTTKGQPLDSTVTIVYYLYRQAFELLHYGYGSAVAYGLFAVTMLITLVMVWYSRKSKVEAF